MARNFFDQIVYSSANEDGRSELRALTLGPEDTALTVAGSGARVFDLLLSDSAHIVAVDFNLHQCRLVSLKIAAWRVLSREGLLDFLGITGDGGNRWGVYQQEVRPWLSESDQAYWDTHQELIVAGVIYCGVWERFFRLFSLASRPKARALEHLFRASTLGEQHRIWTEEWADWRWSLGMRLFGMRWVWRYILREPGIDRVPPDLDLSAYMSGLFERCVQTHLFRDNAYLHVLLQGRYAADGPLPLHLREEHHELIRSRLDRIELICDSLDSFLLREEHCGRFAGFSLSDLSSYANDQAYARIWEGVRSAAAPGARVCERHFLAAPEPLGGDGFVRDRALEERLRQQDDTFIYRFVCGRFT